MTVTCTNCKKPARVSRHSSTGRCNPCDKAHLEAIRAAVQAVVATGRCPDCGSALRRNLALAGWWTCEQRGADTHRARPLDPPCSWQGFTE